MIMAFCNKLLLKLPKNMRKIIKICVIRSGIFLVIFCSVSLYYLKYKWVISSLLGSVFSCIIFYQLTLSQYMVLKTFSKRMLLSYYLIRLFLYGLLSILVITFKAYLSLVLVFIFSFLFQAQFIFFELFRGVKRHYGLGKR